MTKQHLDKCLTPIRTSARVRFPTQMPKVFVALHGSTFVRVLIVNSITKTIIASAHGSCIEEAATNLRRKIQSESKKAGT